MNMMIGTAIAGAAIASNPTTTAAAPLETDRRALEAYASWLHMERRLICLELYPQHRKTREKFVYGGNAGYNWHFYGTGRIELGRRTPTILARCHDTRSGRRRLAELRRGGGSP